jgi:hypothetical protein
MELPDDEGAQRQAHGAVQQAIEQHIAGQAGGVFHPTQERPEPIVFRAPDRPPLGFLFYNLAPTDQNPHAMVKHVVEQTHANNFEAFGAVVRPNLWPLGVMPHWLGSAQSNYSDGSPATLPRPVAGPGRRTGRWSYRYTPQETRLDFRNKLLRASPDAQVPVVVLDTVPDWTRARRQATKFAEKNGQLSEMVDLLAGQNLADWHASALQIRNAEDLRLADPPDGRRRGDEESDHGLFIAGLIHGLSPRSDVRMRPVLSKYGVGDLHLLLLVLQDIMATKRPEDPLVVNMSLGFLPKMEHLPWLWNGVQPRSNPDFVPDVPVPGERRSMAWLAAHRSDVDRTTQLLHGGVERLMRYLLENNCLGVAAAGNDSQQRVSTQRPRFGPRIPARYESVLGVAATTRNPELGAAYSNVGDELEFGDHVATFGGDITNSDEPKDGVIGVFTAPTFPLAAGQTGPKLRNESGWAAWSGTSFATGLVSGLVAGHWSLERSKGRNPHAESVLVEFNQLAHDYAPSLRAPSIEMKGGWERH